MRKSNFNLQKTVHVARSVNNLSVCTNTFLTMGRQVNAISSACYYNIRNIGRIRQYITIDTCEVTSRQDYANAVPYGLPNTLMERLQRIQNYTARLVTRVRKREHITPVLTSLHWFPVICRSQHKMLVYTYTVFGGARCCLSPDKRSDSGTLLTVPQTRVVKYGNRCFGKAAATVWNNVSVDIRKCRAQDAFKKNVKFLY